MKPITWILLSLLARVVCLPVSSAADQFTFVGNIPVTCPITIKTQKETTPAGFRLTPQEAVEAASEHGRVKCNSKLQQQLYSDSENYYIIKSIFGPMSKDRKAIVVGGLTGIVSVNIPKDSDIPNDLKNEFASERVSFDQIEKSSCVQDRLQMLVDRHGHGTKTIDLFVSKVLNDHGQFVRVYWPQDNSIVTMQIDHLECKSKSTAEIQEVLEWLETKGRIDLQKDVVPTLDDVGSSTYLVDKPWVDAVIDDCKKNGKLISLTPHK